MASYEVDAYGARAKFRDVGIVVLLTIVTLGIYAYFWYYRINRELRDFGRVYNDEKLSAERPGLSVLAITLGALIIVPAIVSYYRTTSRVRQAQRIAQTELTSGWVIFALYVTGIFFLLPLIAIPAYVQSGLNSIWQKYPRWEPEPPVLAQPRQPGQEVAAATESGATTDAPPVPAEQPPPPDASQD